MQKVWCNPVLQVKNDILRLKQTSNCGCKQNLATPFTKNNGVRSFKTGGACQNLGVGKGKIAVSVKNLTVIEAAVGSDFFHRIDDDLKDHDSLEEKLTRLGELKEDPPGYVKLLEMSLPVDITKNWKKAEKYNYHNPSLVDAEWLGEKETRQLQGVGDEFTIKRKKEVFVAIVDVVIKKIKKERSRSQLKKHLRNEHPMMTRLSVPTLSEVNE